MATEANLTPFNSPSPLLAHQYYHSPPINSLAGQAADPCQFVLAFSDLSYSVKTPVKLSFFRKKRRRAWEPTRKLLDSISGEVKTGEILAVLGASGSGKTTLIDALANRIERTSLRGSITLNCEKLEGRLLKAISAYVMQDDLMFPMLTVEETLMFAAEVRLPPSVSASKKKERVQALIDQLDLRAAAKTIIGDEGHRGVSGGERRRVSIGTDIIHDPVILFLDEPTSGLDSTSAFMVVQVLQRIARSGNMVIMSVHQPSYRILGLLDRLIFLSRGQMVYGGPPQGLPEFFAAFGNPVPDGGNPAEFAIDLIRELEDSSPDGAKGLVTLNALNHEARGRSRAEPCPPLQDAVRNSIASGKLVSGAMMDGGAAPASYANSAWVEVPAVTKRALINMWRMPEILAFRLGDMVITGFLIGTIFWQLQDSPQALRERIGFFVITIVTIYFTSTDTLGVYIQEKYIYKRETAYNAYRLTSYVLSNAITTFLPLVFLTIALVPIVFFSVGLAVDGFPFFFLTILATFWAGSGFVTFISGVLSHVVLGYTVAAAILSYFLLLGGFFINRNQIPSYWIWFHYLSLLKYPYEAVMQNEFSDSSRCFSRGVQIFDGTAIGKLPVEKKMEVLTAISQALGFSVSNDTCMTTGSDVLEYQRINQLNKWNCLLVTVAWGFFFRLLFYFSLLFGSRNKRK